MTEGCGLGLGQAEAPLSEDVKLYTRSVQPPGVASARRGGHLSTGGGTTQTECWPTALARLCPAQQAAALDGWVPCWVGRWAWSSPLARHDPLALLPNCRAQRQATPAPKTARHGQAALRHSERAPWLPCDRTKPVAAGSPHGPPGPGGGEATPACSS